MSEKSFLPRSLFIDFLLSRHNFMACISGVFSVGWVSDGRKYLSAANVCSTTLAFVSAA